MEWNQGIDELFILYKSREYLIPLILEKSKEVSNFLAFGKLKEFVPNAINLLVKFEVKSYNCGQNLKTAKNIPVGRETKVLKDIQSRRSTADLREPKSAVDKQCCLLFCTGTQQPL